MQQCFTVVVSTAVAASATMVGCGDNQYIAEGEHYQYVVSEIAVATTSSEAQDHAVDLDGDGRKDNGLGSVFAVLNGQGFQIQPDVTAAVRNGGILLGLDVQTPDLREAKFVGVQVYRGISTVPAPCASSDPLSCGQHLSGNAQIGVAPAMELNYAAGPLQQGIVNTRADELTLKLAFGADALIDIVLHDVVVRMTELTPTTGNVTFAGVVSAQDVSEVVVPQAGKQFARIIDRDCTGVVIGHDCGCKLGSGAAQLVAMLDENYNCEVTDDEIRSNNVVKVLIASDIESSVGPGLSFAVSAKLVGARLVPSE